MTFVVKTFNRPRQCGITIGGIRNHWPGCRVVLVDDGEPLAPDWLRAMADEYIPLPFDTGASEGRNVGIRAATTPLVFVVDEDMHISPRLNLPNLVDGLRHFDILSAFGGPLTMHRRGSRLSVRPGHHGEVGTGFYRADFVGQAWLARRETMLALPWDPDLKTCGEHFDILLRAKDEGVRVGWTPHSRCLSQKAVGKTPKYMKYRARTVYHLAMMVKHGLYCIKAPWGTLKRNRAGNLVHVHGRRLHTPITLEDIR